MIDFITNVVRSELQLFWQQRVQPAIHVLCGGMVFWTRIVTPSEGQNDRDVFSHDIEGFDVEGQEQTAQGENNGVPLERAQMDARAAELAGFAVVPLKEEPALGLGWGANLAVIPMGGRKYRPAGLKAGEVAVYNLHTSQGVIKIRVENGKEGQIEITAPAGRDVVVNGGTKTVTVEGDEVDCGALVIKSIAGVISSTYTDPITNVPKDYAVGVPIPLRGKTKGTATRLKA